MINSKSARLVGPDSSVRGSHQRTLDRLLGAVLWANAEAQVALICSCLPTLRPFIRRYVPGLLTDTGGSRSKSGCMTGLGKMVIPPVASP